MTSNGGYTSFNRGMRSSARGDWCTPSDLYQILVLDPPGRIDVTLRVKGWDGLTDRWPTPWFANPPYGRELPKWTSRMPHMGPGVALLPARTDPAWFHRDVLPHARIEFLRGRLHFDDAGPAPFPSMLCWYGGEI